MKKLMQKVTGVALATLMAASSAGLGVFAAEDGADKIVNVGVTDSLGGVNPLMMDQTEINKYAADLQFLPLVELDPELNFQPMLADSVTTEDNQTFTVHIDDAATWSDGTPVTAEDVEFTILRLASPVVNNTTMMLYAFEGIGDDGFTEEGAASIDGIKVVDDKTITFTAKSPMALTTFENTYGRYIHTLPKHVLVDYSDEELMTLDWFNHPDVISGPYFLTDYDTDHYVSYEANADYWKGAPKIGKLNLKIVEGSQVYSGLQSGEIDITHHTMTAIPQEDYESIESLDNVKTVYGLPITNQSAFIQTANIPDARVRQALLYAIDRNQLVEQLLKGHGEVVDGFLSSASPFFDDSIEPTPYVERLYLEGKNHIQKDMEFHEAIAKCSGNRVVEVLIPVILTAITTFANLTNRKLQKETIETHRAITDAMLQGDSMGVKCAMIMHLTYNRQMLIEMTRIDKSDQTS